MEALSSKMRLEASMSNGHTESNKHQVNVVIRLQARQCNNLQNALRNIIKAVIVQRHSLNAYPEFLNKHKRLLPLNFDMELLVRFLEEEASFGIVISLVNIETFDSQTLADLISTLHLWQRQIPFVLVLGVTSTIELLESRLPKSCLRLLNARAFTFKPHTDLPSDILRRVQQVSVAESGPLLGASVVSALNEMTQNQAFSAQSLKQVLKFGFISHYLVNPTTSVITGAISVSSKEQRHQSMETIRRTSSFQRYCEHLLHKKDGVSSAKVRKLLDNDKALIDEVQKAAREANRDFYISLSVITMMIDLHELTFVDDSARPKSRLTKETELYRVMHDLSDSTIFDELEVWFTKIEAKSLLPVLRTLSSRQYEKSIEENIRQSIILCEAALNVVPNDGQVSGSMKDSASSMVSLQIWTTLANCIRSSSFDLSSALLCEAYVLSTRSVPLRQNFEARSRGALERALLRPGDYLGCECCTNHSKSDNRDAVNKSQGEIEEDSVRSGIGVLPPVCILFSLLQEAPTIINLRDLFDAFCSRYSRGSNASLDEDAGEDLNPALAQFYRALAELKMIGLVKASTGTQIKKRTSKISKSSIQEIDFVAKTSWAGL